MAGVEPQRVLVCEDAPGFQILTQTVLEEAGFEIAGLAETWVEAIGLATEHQPDAILLDLWLPFFDRDRVVRVREAAPDALLVVVSALAPDEARERLDGIAGIDLVLTKRAALDEVVAALRDGLAAREL